jgi:hypothetical protein
MENCREQRERRPAGTALSSCAYWDLPVLEDPEPAPAADPLPDVPPGVDGVEAEPDELFGAEDEPLPLMEPPGAGAVADPLVVPLPVPEPE